jgi:hypothetical protein
MDYNLFGMNFIHLSSVKFRRLPTSVDENPNEFAVSKYITKSLDSSSSSALKWNVEELSEYVQNKNQSIE